MTASALNPLRGDTPSNSSLAGSQAMAKSSAAVDKGVVQQNKKLEEASRQFEAVFLRQMLSSIGRAAGGTSAQSSGNTVYGSMLVDAVSEAVSRAGGIGLGSMLVKALQPPESGGFTSRGDSTSQLASMSSASRLKRQPDSAQGPPLSSTSGRERTP